MKMITNFPLAIIFILLLTSFTMPLIKNNKKIKIISIISMIFSNILSIFILIYVTMFGSFSFQIGHVGTHFGIEFYVGNIEAIIAVAFTYVTSLVLYYSVYTIDSEIKDNKIKFYYLLINILLASLLGIVFSNDLFNSYVFIEVATLASCGIIVIKDHKESISAALKYLIMSIIGSGLILMSIAFIYSYTGHLNMTLIHNTIIHTYNNYPNSIVIILTLFTAGLGVKSAMFPLHTWLPDAHSNAPTSSSALLSGIVLKAFVILLLKIIYRVIGLQITLQFGILNIIFILGCIGMIWGSVCAIFQTNIKKLIAYSSIAQMGYIFFGIGIGTIYGATIAVFHIINHAVTKPALFLISGLLIEKTKSKNIDQYKGLGIEMPISFVLFSLCAFSMVGIPVLPGFISKWYLSLATISSGKYIFIFIILISSLLNAVYYFPIIINGFFGTDNLKDRLYQSKKVSLKKLMPIILLVLTMIFVGIFSKFILDFIALGFE